MHDKAQVKSTVKDSVFTHLFTIPEYQLQMYRVLHPEDTGIRESDLVTITRRCVVAKHTYNDLGILARNRLIILVEAQSTWSPNIIIRMMSYAMQSLTDYFQRHDVYLYANSKARCPRPELYVIYTGDRVNQPKTLSFREIFFSGDDRCDLDATVHFWYYRDGSSDIINQYITFCRILTEQFKIFGRTKEALVETFRLCCDRKVLESYLKQRETEIMDIMTMLFDQDNVTEQYGRHCAREATKEAEKKIRAAEKKAQTAEKKAQEIAKEAEKATKEAEKAKKKAQEADRARAVKTAINMLKKNMAIDLIHELTELSVEEINEIQKEMSV